jgi:xylan 1,4-beta-xylosidase
MLKRTLLTLLAMGLVATMLPAQQEVRIHVNVSERQGPFQPVWAWVGHDEPNYTYSEEGRELFSELAQLSPYPVHDRTHNLLTSGDGTPALKWGSTNAFTLDASGQPIYNWAIIDKIFDTYQATGITPFVEIGFMPEALSTHPEPYQHHWPHGPLFTGWSYPPKDYKQWAELLYQWVQHMVERYGAQKMESWEWEVWNEPDIGHGYWHGSLDEYCKLYDYTADAVKRALPGARVGGPASTGPARQEAAHFLQGFLDHCVNGKNYVNGKTGAPLDFISFHAKGRTKFVDGHVELNIGNNLRHIDQGFGIIAGFPTLRALPVVLSESDPEGCAACDATSHPQNGYRLTSQYASYEADLLSGTLALAERHHINLQGAITWAFTFPGQPYFAGYRAFITHDVDLPLLNLFRMLGLMGGERVAAESTGAQSLDGVLQSSVRAQPDVNVIATHRERGVNVLVWNYDDDAPPSPTAEISLTVEGLPREAQQVLLEHFRLDQDHSSSYTAWRAMDSPQNPSSAQYAQLKAAGTLQLLESPRWTQVKGHTIKLTFTEPRQGVSLLSITW